MKRHLKLALLAIAVTGCLTSCLKDENTTVLYSSQQIPDINFFMPSSLLQVMGNENLHFGDEPPRISGTFYADRIVTRKASFIDTTMTTHNVIVGNPQVSSYFHIHDQHKGILKCEYSAPRPGTDVVELSRTDSTYAHMRNTAAPLIDSPYKPSYFDAPLNYDDFHQAYIMGKGNDFTIYYYETLINYVPPTSFVPVNNFYPLVANIISGTLDTRTVIVQDTVNHTTDTVQEQIIKNFIWGKENMGYFSNNPMLPLFIEQGFQPKPGDAWYNDNSSRDVYQKPFEGDI